MNNTAIIAIVAAIAVVASGTAIFAINNNHHDDTHVDDSDSDGASPTPTTITEDPTDKFWKTMLNTRNKNGTSIKIGTARKPLYSNSDPSPTVKTSTQTYKQHITEFSYQNGYIIITETTNQGQNYNFSTEAYTSVTKTVTQDWHRVTAVNLITYTDTINNTQGTVTLHL